MHPPGGSRTDAGTSAGSNEGALDMMTIPLLVLFFCSGPADAELVKVTPSNQKEHVFPLSVKREANGQTRIEFPARAKRGAVWGVTLLIRRNNVDDNLTVARFEASVRSFEETTAGRRALSFMVDDEFVKHCGVLVRYGTPEVEAIYSINLADWIGKKE